jgi:hypothetical protein
MSLTYRKPGAKEGRPLNKLQQLASQENFAIFTIKGMLGMLTHLKRCDTVPYGSIASVEKTLTNMLLKIKWEQKQRKLKREESKNGKA